VSPAPECELSNADWAGNAQKHLKPLVRAVTGLEKALAATAVIESGPVAALASEVFAAIDALMVFLGETEAPEPLRTAEGELGAAAGVYRNAASLFRSLPGTDTEQRAARLSACSIMLSQGDHHVEVFDSEVRRTSEG
jgi:hypothetical protein